MLKKHTIKEVAKKINVPARTLKQWEKDFNDSLQIPRTSGGARLYSNKEVDLLLKIKQMCSEKLPIEMIRSLLQREESECVILEPSPSFVPEKIQEPAILQESSMMNMETFFQAIESYKNTMIKEVKTEIQTVVRKELLEDVKKEIAKGTLQTVKNLSDSIYKSSEKTKEEIQNFSSSIEKTNEQTIETIEALSGNIMIDSKIRSTEYRSLSSKLSKTSLDISNLKRDLKSDREANLEDREQYRHEIIQREAAFRDMLTSYRDAAVSKEKRWWQIW